MKLEENMYVRNTFGRIAKIEYIEDNTAFCDNWLWQSYEDHIDFINFKDEEDVEDIVKASFNIIDLIEVGDYVNGYQVKSVSLIGKKKYEAEIRIPNNKKGVLIERIRNNEDIKSILTHQQFEQMSYKLGE